MHLPGPLRAAVGLAATAADELKNLPDRAVELPMLAVSTALQLSLRAQQRYARLAARGEQFLNREQPSEDPPPWATFDEPVSVDELRRAAMTQLDSLVDGGGPPDDTLSDLLGGGQEPANGRSAGRMFEDLFGVSDPAGGGDAAVAGPAPDSGATVTPISEAPGAAGKSGAAPRKSARKTSRKTATRKTATKSAPVKTTEQAASDAPPAKKAPRKATKAAEPKDSPQSGKQVNKPRHTAPSKFDDAGDS